MQKETLIAILGGLGSMLGWGSGDFFARKSIDKVGNTVALFWMQFLGIIPLLIYLLFTQDFSGINLNNTTGIVFFGLLNMTPYLLYYKAIEKGKLSIVSPINASYAAFSVIISALFLNEKISTTVYWLLGLVFIGILLLSFSFKQLKIDLQDKNNVSKGVLYAVLSAVLFGFWFPLWDDFVGESNWIILLIGMRLSVTILLYIYAKFKKIKLFFKSKKVWKWVFIIAALDAMAFFSLTWAFEATTQTSVVSVLAATFSLPTLVLSRIFLKEKLALNQWIGIISVLTGMALIAWFSA
ncbi:EamA family transporter [Candidatus Dojkabacteria bacterium]|nr:EamA family transporter [Candidatus Dojkabacteria bacterium]